MTVRRIVVCEAQVPFVRGGAESHVRELVRQLRAHGYAVELISVPFKWYPKEEILAHATAWRLLDLSESNGEPIDLAIGTKFPSYFVRHPNKVTWLIHQYRAAYELCGTGYSDFDHTEGDVGLRDRLMTLDTQMLGECQRLFTNARNTAKRLERYNGLRAEPLYHPPRLAARLRGGPADGYLLSVGRIEAVKRVDLAIRALAAHGGALRLVVAGDGSCLSQLRRVADEVGIADRVDFLGAVTDDRLIDLYANALAVIFVPYDEDYGYVTLEAFLARKPVVTTVDAGGPGEFVEHEVNGLACEPQPEALAEAIDRLERRPQWAADLGASGFARAKQITWDGVIDRLVAAP